MSDENPRIFEITHKLRQTYHSVVDDVMDSNRANDMCLKNLLYILRCQMSDERFYRPLTGLAGNADYDTVRLAKLNFAKLYRQCDVLNILPEPALGLIRSSYRMVPLPIPKQLRAVLVDTIKRQRTIAVDILQSYTQSFVIFVSNYGISQAVSLPTLSVVLPDLTSPSSVSAISRLRECFDPFNFSAVLLRISCGEIKQIGEIWSYPRVPLGSSLSGGDDDKAGTLGGYCRNPDTGEIYGITAAHVVGTSPNREVFAPASKPYNEAVKSIEIRVKETAKAGKDDTAWSNKLSALKNLDRLFGKTLHSAQSCTDDGRVIDCALIKISGSRDADNRVSKIPDFVSQFPEFTDEGDKIVALTSPVMTGEIVWKYGIRSKLTKGTTLEHLTIKLDASNCTRAVDESNAVPCTAMGILGEWDPTEGAFREFAKPGDSGSFILRIVKDPSESVEEEAVVIRTEAAGLLYGIVWEETRESYVALYMKMDEVIDEFVEGIGVKVDLEVPDAKDTEWPYIVMGRGRSTYELH